MNNDLNRRRQSLKDDKLRACKVAGGNPEHIPDGGGGGFGISARQAAITFAFRVCVCVCVTQHESFLGVCDPPFFHATSPSFFFARALLFLLFSFRDTLSRVCGSQAKEERKVIGRRALDKALIF
jgi:hypothetical protein